MTYYLILKVVPNLTSFFSLKCLARLPLFAKTAKKYLANSQNEEANKNVRTSIENFFSSLPSNIFSSNLLLHLTQFLLKLRVNNGNIKINSHDSACSRWLKATSLKHKTSRFLVSRQNLCDELETGYEIKSRRAWKPFSLVHT